MRYEYIFPNVKQSDMIIIQIIKQQSDNRTDSHTTILQGLTGASGPITFMRNLFANCRSQLSPGLSLVPQNVSNT